MSGFTRIWPNTYESDEGYSVEIVQRADFPAVTMRYREGARTIDVFAEAMAGPALDFMLDPTSIRAWNAPHKSERIDDALRERILQRIQAAMSFAGFGTDRFGR